MSGRRLRAVWRRRTSSLDWTPPTSTEIGVVAKSAIAAGVAWIAAQAISDASAPVLAPLTAVVVVQVSVRASVRAGLERSAAVVAGVLLAVAVGDALPLNAVTVALVVGASLGVAQLVVRLPPAAARQVPISFLVVLTAIEANDDTSSWQRVADTAVGALIGVVVAFVLPASRVVDARQTLDRLSEHLAALLDEMGDGLQHDVTAEQTAAWRIEARTIRERMVVQAIEAVGNSREASQWNVRDRRRLPELARYEAALPRFERTAIGVSVIARGLDDHAAIFESGHDAMPSLGALLRSLADLVRAVRSQVLHGAADVDVAAASAQVVDRRQRCVFAAQRRAGLAQNDTPDPRAETEWLNYTAMLVQVDRIVVDLHAPLPPDQGEIATRSG
jgi:uncharacterized membrane protein YgaE (UPF0421/DUF939 family)